MPTTTLDTGLYSSCSREYIDGKFQTLDNSDILKCCIDRCEYPNAICNNICYSEYSNDDKCLSRCDIQNVVCKNSCKLEDIWDDYNIINTCVKENECQLGDEKCISNKKDDIMHCCDSICKPRTDINCSKLCPYLYDLALKPIRREIIVSPKNSALSLEGSDKNTVKSSHYGFVILIFLLCIAIIFFIIMLKLIFAFKKSNLVTR